jgi:Helix-turn-helix domain
MYAIARPRSFLALDVGFQEVVQLVRTEELRLRSFSVPRRDQMNSHKNAPLTPKGREAMVRCVEAGLSKAAAALQFNTTPKTVAKWVERFRADDERWFARPLLQASFIAKPNGAFHVRYH